MADNKDQKGFWLSMPGILTGLAAVIGAIGTTYVAIKDNPQPAVSPQAPVTTTLEHQPTTTTTPIEVTPVSNPVVVTEEEIAAPYTVNGIWEYTADSQVSGAHCVNRLRLTMEESFVVGIFDTCDGTGSGVEGTYQNDVLKFSRNTGLSTVQKFELTKVDDDKFTGTFWNVGQHQDAGTIVIVR